ncbi:hypothetical protein [Halobacillus aidingensis]|uniref:Uncharacterized protein n=1 Tax=Halobacillus aidingensis TaxID=240303 RepID=A0A1H0ISF6_HALAD|nr:hypothetical protein [Halobacillus aidingensis]SDO34374.1 hypothetical protein SAMN05421677_104174 [Halobacillus aidingensis]
MTQEKFWNIAGPILLIASGWFMLYAAYKYNEEQHEKMDWENQEWAGALSQWILPEAPWWVLRVVFAAIGVALISIAVYHWIIILL